MEGKTSRSGVVKGYHDKNDQGRLQEDCFREIPELEKFCFHSRRSSNMRNWPTQPTKLRIVITTWTSACYVLNMSKRIATACTKLRIFDEPALAPSLFRIPRNHEYFPRTLNINLLNIYKVFIHFSYYKCYMRIVYLKKYCQLHFYIFCV